MTSNLMMYTHEMSKDMFPHNGTEKS